MSASASGVTAATGRDLVIKIQKFSVGIFCSTTTPDLLVSAEARARLVLVPIPRQAKSAPNS